MRRTLHSVPGSADHSFFTDAKTLCQRVFVGGCAYGPRQPGGRSRNRDSRARRQSVHSACTHYALFLYTIRGAEPKMGAGIHWYQSTTRYCPELLGFRVNVDLRTVTDANSHVTTYAYDAAGQTQSVWLRQNE